MSSVRYLTKSDGTRVLQQFSVTELRWLDVQEVVEPQAAKPTAPAAPTPPPDAPKA